MQLHLISANDLRSVVDMPLAIDAVARAFAQRTRGRARDPLRSSLEVEGGVTLVMPGWVDGMPGNGRGGPEGLGTKVVSVFPGNPDLGHPSVTAVVLLVDPATGLPRALVEGTSLTALRTGAASGVATRHLAREDARVLAVFGAGVQARAQIEAIRCVRRIREVRIVSRTGTSAERLAAELQEEGGPLEARAVRDPREALAGADVVVAATDSSVPVFPGEAVEPGTHVNGVGSYTPEMREVDVELVARSTVVVDGREAAWAEAGDLIQAADEGAIERPGHVQADLGEVVLGRHPGRSDSDEITFFKSVGSAIQDVAVAAEALRRAEEAGVGRIVEM